MCEDQTPAPVEQMCAELQYHGVIHPIRSIRELWLEYGNLTDRDPAMDAIWDTMPLPRQTRDLAPDTTSEMRQFLDLVRELLSDISMTRLDTPVGVNARVTGAIGVLAQLCDRDYFAYGPICKAHLNSILSCENGCG